MDPNHGCSGRAERAEPCQETTKRMEAAPIDIVCATPGDRIGTLLSCKY